MNNNNNNKSITTYVDVHGNRINATRTATGQILIPLEEIRETGFHLYEECGNKNNFDPTSSVHMDEFRLYMLQAAKEYCFHNRVYSVEANELLSTIKYCKDVLLSGQHDKKTTSDQHPLQSAINYKEHPVVQGRKQQQQSPLSQRLSVGSNSPFGPAIFKSNSFHTAAYNSTSPNNNTNNNNNHRHDSCSSGGSSSRNNDVTSRRDVITQSIQLKDGVQMVKIIRLVSHPSGKYYWVQPVGTNTVLQEMNGKINDLKLDTCNNPEMHQIYLGQNQGQWTRCKVIQINPLRVFFIDAGLNREIDNLCNCPNDLCAIPCQAIKIIIENPNTDRVLQAKEIIKIKPITLLRSGEYKVELISDDSDNSVISSPPSQPTFDIPKPLCVIENGQIVIISGAHDDGTFTLRTRECYKTLKELNITIAEYINANTIEIKNHQNVKIGQLMLTNQMQNNEIDPIIFYRCVVLNVKDAIVKVQYLDYNETAELPIDSLKILLDERVAKYPKTYFVSPKLTDFIKFPFNEKAKAFIADLIGTNTKFTVILEDDDKGFERFDLQFFNGELLSEKLREFEPPKKATIVVQPTPSPPPRVQEVKKLSSAATENKKVFLKDMNYINVEMGINTYQCYFKRPNDITLIAADIESIQHLENVLIDDTYSDTTPYQPKVNEMCLGLYEDEWSRCVINDIYSDKYLAIFVDYGNVEMLQMQGLRKFPEKFKDIPILGIKAKLVGCPKVEEKIPYFKDLISDGDLIEVDVKSMVKQNEYEIEMPEIYKKIADQLAD